MRSEDLIYEWSSAGPSAPITGTTVELMDETLRDGLQSSSVIDPPIEDKIKLMHLMESLGVDCVNVGLPGAGLAATKAADTLVREIVRADLNIEPVCAGRTLIQDVEPIVKISQDHGRPVMAYLFLGSSPIRMFVENWDLKKLIAVSRSAIEYARGEGLEVCFVTEDTTRSDPETLRPLFLEALDAGASRLCLCDTTGSACPSAVTNLIRFTHEVVAEFGGEVGLDWHGHRDRGLSLINALTAMAEGVPRIHGTALGIGERCGNTPMDHLLVNLKLLGVRNGDLTRLLEYVNLAHESIQAPLPLNYPMLGRDAFSTATGVHAAAVIKALASGDEWLVDRVYSGVPASWMGRAQRIEVGPMSGASNVRYWLKQEGFRVEQYVVDAVLKAAKQSDRLLTWDEIVSIVEQLPSMEPK